MTLEEAMKRPIPTLIALIAFALGYIPAGSAAEEQSDTPEILKTAMKLEGRWRANARLALGEQTHAFVYTLHFRKTAGGNALTMDEHAEVKEVGELFGANLIGFDPYENRLHWFSVDNFGTTHDHIGQLIAPGHLRLTHESRREGKPFREEIDFVWRTADEVNARLVATLGGDVVETLEGKFVRVGK
jgi:hypothetical protein